MTLCVAAALPSAQAEPRPVKAVEVAKNAWFVQGEAALGSTANRNFISNAGFVVTDDGVVAIDALGSPALATELLAEIRRVTPQPLRYVILTHYHADHIYGLQVLKAAGATILAHESGKAYLNSDTARQRLQSSRRDIAPWIDADTRVVPADRWLDQEDLTLRVGTTDIQVRHVGLAHTPEDLVVYVPDSGVLFAGDLVFRGRIPFVGEADSRHWIESLGRLIEIRPKVLIPGHGPASTEPVADLELTREYLKYLRTTMAEAARNLEPFDDAYAKADWSRFEHLPLFKAANRMNAYNTYLLM
ncbi:MAG: MBL fold metallo-hydrolase [Rubrivivax sp. SCN 70-15]|nr:MAG: MBL fold metallo-hydrolase [Rubrivivax sp. SCN 70-15]